MANFKWSDLDKYAKKQNMRLEQIVRRSLLEVSRDVVLMTPVDTGRARNNWQASVNRIPTGSKMGEDKSGAKAIDEASKATANAVGEVYYLINNAVYIRALEYGHSNQAPNGMVRISVKNMNTILKNAINSTR